MTPPPVREPGPPRPRHPEIGAGSGRRPRPWASVAVHAGVLMVLLAGCGLFDIREPDPPVGNIPRHIPNDPDSVVLNLETGVRYKLAGSANISEALATDFIMVLDPLDAKSLGGLDTLRKVDTETGFNSFFTLKVKGDGIFLDIQQDSVDFQVVDSGTRLYRNTPYEAKIHAGKDPTTGVKETLLGYIDLYIRDSGNGNYAIIQWVDKARGSNQSTLGYYLGYYSGAGS